MKGEPWHRTLVDGVQNFVDFRQRSGRVVGHYNLLVDRRRSILKPGLMKDHGQQARASKNFARPVDFETPRPDLPVHLYMVFQNLQAQQNFHWPWPVGRGLS